ncbi:hypothetical protein KQJ29_37880, partial [Enterococcus sp. S181_ASV_20]|nr:hypothetical protein [Enterococcus sp. S181_ASV_20]
LHSQLRRQRQMCIRDSFTFEDMVKGEISFESDNVGGDFIIQKRDGMPTYNFAVAVDCLLYTSDAADEV